MTQRAIAANALRAGDSGDFSRGAFGEGEAGPALTITAFRPVGHDGRWPMSVAVMLRGETAWRVLPAEAVYLVERA